MKKITLLIITLLIASNIFATTAPSLYYPADNSTGWYTDRSVRCYLVDGDQTPANYTFQMDVVSTFDSPAFTERQGTDYYSSPQQIRLENIDLLYNQQYYWRVKYFDGTSYSAWSETWNFTTLAKINNYSPANNSINQITDRSIRCNIEDYNTAYSNYEFEIDTVPTFDSGAYEFSSGDGYSSSYDYIWKTNTDLLYGQTYYWRARVKNSNSTSEWSETWSFTTLDQLTLYSPADNSTNIFTSVGIKCNIEDYNTDFNNYEFEMDTTPNFNSSLYEISHGTSYSSSYDYINKSNSDLLYGTKYYWRARVRNVNDTSQWSVTRNFTTLEKINLYTPSNNSTGITINTNVSCYDEDYHTEYEDYDFQLDTTSNFNSPILISEIGTGYNSSYDFVFFTNSGLRYGQEYYWRARVRNANDTALWSEVRIFTTAYELTDIPILISPTDNSIDIAYGSFSIDWNSISGANNYQYQISTTNDFTAIIRSGNTSLTDHTITNLQPNTTYFWRVRGENANGYSNWSTVWSFTTETAIMTAPILQTPVNNSIDISYTTVNFNWQDVFGANEYIFEISQDNTFTSGVTTQNISLSNNSLSGLNENTQYFWRVASTDGSTTSSWSEIWNFTTETDVTGIKNMIKNEINIYPNPAQNFITIDYKSTNKLSIDIYNVNGQLILSNQNTDKIINISDFISGTYIIKIKDNKTILGTNIFMKK